MYVQKRILFMGQCMYIYSALAVLELAGVEGYESSDNEHGVEHVVLEGEQRQAHVGEDEVLCQEAQQLKQLGRKETAEEQTSPTTTTHPVAALLSMLTLQSQSRKTRCEYGTPRGHNYASRIRV